MKALRKRGILSRIIIPILILFPISIGVIYYAVSAWSVENLVNSQIKSSLNSINQYKSIRGYYTKNVVSKVKKSGNMKIHFEHKDDPKTIPLPATFIHELSAKFKEDKTSTTQLNLYSLFPFPNRKERKLDTFQVEAAKYLVKNPEEHYIRTFLSETGSETVRVAIADKMVAQGCVTCHNNHPLTPKNDWKLGDVRGVLEITSNIAVQVQDVKTMDMKVIGILAIVFLLILGTLYILLMSSIVKPIGELSHKISQSTSSTLASISDLKSQAVDLADVSTKQASAIQETASSLEEVKTTSQRSLDSAREVNTRSEDNKTNAHSGVEAIHNMIDSIDKISESNESILKNVDESNKEFEEVIRIISEITDKTKIINDIVFQTKLLSFNASVEAARAGEQGKGFSVVAEEVGNLAQVSGSASEEIQSLLDGSIDKVKKIVENTQSSVSKLVNEGKIKVEHGNKVAKGCEGILEKIEMSTIDIANSMDSIESSSQEQSLGFEEISDTIHEISDSVEKSAQISKVVSDHTREVENNIVELNDLIKNLEKQVTGEDT